MADKKISALTSASTPLAGTEVLPIVQSGTTVKVAVSDLTAGRAVTTGALTVSASAASFGLGGTGTNNAVVTINGSSASSYGAHAVLQRNGVNQWVIGCDSGINGGTSSDLTVYSAANNIRLYNNVKTMNGNFVVGTAGKGLTTDVANGNVTITPLGTGSTVLAKNGAKISANAPVTVGTGATQISVNVSTLAGLAFIYGVDASSNAFSDLVFYADGTAVALASRSVSGAPAARTYTAPSGQLNLAMGSGSYSVYFQHIMLS